MDSIVDSINRDRVRRAEVSAKILVESGPGTGKTELAADRINNLISSGLLPRQLLILSFSRSAVKNLTKRLAQVNHTNSSILEELRHVSIRTFDSWAFRVLRRLGYPPDELLKNSYDENIRILTESISNTEREKFCRLMNNCRHLIVDEFQDLPGVRGDLVLTLLELISPPKQNSTGFTILGDLAQAIFSFGSSTNGQSVRRPEEYWNQIQNAYESELEKFTLTRNYRTSGLLGQRSAILRRILLGNKTGDEKLKTVQKEFAKLSPISKTTNDEWLTNQAYRKFAILTRTNGESLREFKNLFGKTEDGGSLPVSLRAGNHSILPPPWVAALFRCLRTKELTKSRFTRIYNHLTQQWNDAICKDLGLPSLEHTWPRLAIASGGTEGTSSINLHNLRSRMNWPDSFPDDQFEGEDGLIISTIHQSKGLEFDNVAVLDFCDSNVMNTNDSGNSNKNSELEEANVYYVAMTRARKEVYKLDSHENYPVLRERNDFSNNRKRYWSWKNGWMNFEIGVDGDIDPFGFVDTELHGGETGVEQNQEFLLKNALSLQGRKAVLCKHSADQGKTVTWKIHIQKDGKPDRLIGRTSNHLAIDLLKVIYNKGFALPHTIWNLRISGVGTVSSEDAFPLREPYKSSRLWLGVSLIGTGDFKTYRNKGT